MRPILIALALALPGTAFAQETVGAMSGMLGGDRVAYSVLSGDEYETGWRETDDGVEVTLDAYPSDTPVSDEDRLRIVFTATSAYRDPELDTARVSLSRPDGDLEATEDAVTLVLDSMEISGDGMLLIGNITATLSEDGRPLEVASPEGVTISYDIQANLFPRDQD